MYQRVNVYDNFIDLFGKGFVSPTSDLGLLYYKYYLLDSTYIDSQWCYKLKFKPRRPQELTFTGEFWVQDTTWAIKKINMRHRRRGECELGGGYGHRSRIYAC